MRTVPLPVILTLSAGLIACAQTATPVLATLAGPTASAAPTETLAPTPTSTPPPTRTPDLFSNPVLVIAGEEEVVFDWTTDRCEDWNLPDLPARAFRGADGQVQLILSHSASRRMVGPDLNTLAVECNVVLATHHSADPALFSDNEWLAAPYTEDGVTVFALVHNEHQGHTHAGQCPSGDYFSCWYNSITLAVSTDGGATYAPAAAPPGHLVAAPPLRYEPDGGPYGIRSPSNIIKGRDGYYYTYVNYLEYETENQWVCLLRTNNLSDPASWRFWDGDGFDGQFINPYVDSLQDASAHACPPLDWDDIGASLNDSITYSTVMDKYVLIGISADHIDGREVWGWYYAFSDDLIHWSHRKLLQEVALPWTVGNGGTDLSHLYPSLLDPDSESRNFETTDMTAYLYFTRMNFGQGSFDRDLIRIPVQFFGSVKEAQP